MDTAHETEEPVTVTMQPTASPRGLTLEKSLSADDAVVVASTSSQAATTSGVVLQPTIMSHSYPNLERQKRHIRFLEEEEAGGQTRDEEAFRTVVINYDAAKSSYPREDSSTPELSEERNEVDEDKALINIPSSSDTDDSDEILQYAKLEPVFEPEEQKVVVMENVKEQSRVEVLELLTYNGLEFATLSEHEPKLEIIDDEAPNVCKRNSTTSTERQTQTKRIEQKEKNIQTESEVATTSTTTSTIVAAEAKPDKNNKSIKVVAKPNNAVKQRALELHRNRIMVEQKKMDLLEIKIARERDEMLRSAILFEKDLEIKNAQLNQITG